jgi:hypothetical protein
MDHFARQDTPAPPDGTQVATLYGFRKTLASLDRWITTSRFGRFFHLSGSGHVSLMITTP